MTIARIIPDRSYPTTVTTVPPSNSMLQSMLDKGGIIEIPAGEYFIDTSSPLMPRSNSWVRMDRQAKFRAIPNGLQRSQMWLVTNVNNVRMTGGSMIGERYQHDYSDTSGSGTHEWGHAFAVWSATACTFADIDVRDFHGDAFSVGARGQGTNPQARDIVMSRIVAVNNRRQGLSVTHAKSLFVYDSHFIETNGTSPECGIDIEPEYGQIAEDIHIIGCRLAENAKYGANVLRRTGTSPGGIVRRITFAENTIEGNKSNGFYASTVDGLEFFENTVQLNGATGAVMNNVAALLYSNNVSGKNYTKQGVIDRTDFTQTGWSSKIERDLLLRGSTSPTGVKTNRYI